MYVDGTVEPDLTLEKVSIIEYLCFKYNKKFTEPSIDNIHKVYITNKDNILILYTIPPDSITKFLEKPFYYDDYRQWIRSKKINKIRYDSTNKR